MVCPPESGTSSAVLECYLAVVAEMAWCIGVTCPEAAAPHQEHLLRMRSRLAFGADEGTLAETREAIENELRTHAERARAFTERRTDDLTRILKAFSQMTQVLAERNEAYVQQFAQFSARVNGIADVVPWLDIRDALREILSDMGAQVDVLQLDSQLAQAHVDEQIRVFQSRLAAKNPQHLDLLTGLGNRRAVEEQITRRMDSGKPFTLLLFQTADLTGIVEKEGAAAADQVLVQTASRLAGQVRAHDYVGRWAANEFAIVMECPLETAEPRSQQIARWLSGTYVLRGGMGETLVDATFTVRAVDPSQATSLTAGAASEEPAPSPLPG